MVPHYERMSNVGQGRPVVPPHGWKHDPTAGDEFIDPETKQKKNHGAFLKHAPDVIVVPDCVEYRRHLRDKDLWPADQATAQAAGVPFDPSFGDDEDLAHHTPKAPEATETKPEMWAGGPAFKRPEAGADVKSRLVAVNPESPAIVAEKA